MTAPTRPEFSWAQVCARRLERHWLAAPSENGTPADIVRAMCGAHAQVITAAELSVGIRTARMSLAEVRRALWEDATLVKAFGPRGTVHLLPADDLSLWTGVLGAISPAAAPGGGFLTAAQTDQVVEAIAEALGDGELTVDELGGAVIGQTGAWAGEFVMPAFQGMWPRWRAALTTAGYRGALCFGPNRGRLATYRRPAGIVPGFRPADAATATAWLVRSYLHAYGPATPAHFAQWLGASRTWAAEVFDSLAGELAPVTVEGAPAWVASGDTRTPVAEPSGTRLLPYFDAYVVGGRPRSLLFPGQASKRALARGQAGNFPVMLVDGVVGGVWHLRRSGRRVDITVEAFGRLLPAQVDELGLQAERIGTYLGSESRLTLGPVNAGGHA
ncbi:winged helix DNA-binding domain-containing protein [Arthrobacter sp. ZGTC131]|uniref:winged helix DNA-binding domain-containing protein n=1 Tax=Arthrobacter sp. ZGTC131 TaxID=2058898 RepID=UPI000CE3AEEB|nr:winged helix DNA-binding domain-containing protein [Arthrobacter sp. ZGTC131]